MRNQMTSGKAASLLKAAGYAAGSVGCAELLAFLYGLSAAIAEAGSFVANSNCGSEYNFWQNHLAF